MHKPVLLHESIESLDLEHGETFLDGTFGNGGHSKEVKKLFGKEVRLVCIDRDPEQAHKFPKFNVATENFANLDRVLKERGISSVDAILFDLGFSSEQLESRRGFSFLKKDEPLDMRLSKTGLSAADILNSWDEHAIELVLRGFGEERYSKKIAREIVETRSRFAKSTEDKRKKAFKTTKDLIRVIERVKPKRRGEKIHRATKTFQALRMTVNEELTSLEKGLEKGFNALSPGGRFVVISFHSLEDRIVKNFFRDRAGEGFAEVLTKKPITASKEEILINPRSRSAKLRAIEKTND